MGTYDKKVNQLKDLMKRKYKSVYDKSKEIDIMATKKQILESDELLQQKKELIIFQMKDSRNIKSSCQIPIKRNSVSRDIIM